MDHWRQENGQNMKSEENSKSEKERYLNLSAGKNLQNFVDGITDSVNLIKVWNSISSNGRYRQETILSITNWESCDSRWEKW